ncbi:unnamed protein product [Adineta steineri]|uniref:Uncharacterized protein n=1 Tax=Adineta steineri TaxID=433720 RepID=A0A815VYA1_9BILA|nr:unnamed protein product [Adineta steineri]CAF1657403.1 unnamed protein product [Adineta steineri]
MADDWFITPSFVFPNHFSSSINLSEELIKCVQMEQEQYDKLLHEYKQIVELLKQRDHEMSERLIVLKEFYDEFKKINEIYSFKDVLNSYMWNNLHKMTDDLENLCSNMIDTRTSENTNNLELLISIKQTV